MKKIMICIALTFGLTPTLKPEISDGVITTAIVGVTTLLTVNYIRDVAQGSAEGSWGWNLGTYRGDCQQDRDSYLGPALTTIPLALWFISQN